MPTNFRGIGAETGGVMLILLGVAGFFVGFGGVLRLSTLLVIYFGARDVAAPYAGRPPSILVLVAGIWLAVCAYQIFGFDFLNAWPLLVVLVGLSLIFDGIVDSARPGASQAAGP